MLIAFYPERKEIFLGILQDRKDEETPREKTCVITVPDPASGHVLPCRERGRDENEVGGRRAVA